MPTHGRGYTKVGVIVYRLNSIVVTKAGGTSLLAFGTVVVAINVIV